MRLLVWSKILSFCLICVFLSACQAGYNDKLEDYLGRLENILNEDRPPKKSISVGLIKFPNKRDSQFQLSEQQQSIGILEFLSLDECKIQQTIAEKNNNLGKVASQSQQLLNSIAFISYSPACLALLKENGKNQLNKKLKDSLQIKKKQLPALLWQATLNEAEYRAFWKTANIDFSYPESLPPKQADAIKQLIKFTQNTLNFTEIDQNLEDTLGVIRLGDGGQLFSAYAHLHHQLNIANEIVEKALNKPFCSAGRTNAKIKILNNMMTVFFIPEIQQLSNQLNMRYQAIMPHILQLEELHIETEHSNFRDWRIKRNQFFDLARNSTRKHVKLINQLYQQCAAKPKGKSL